MSFGPQAKTMAHLVSAWDFYQQAGESHTRISVHNLQANLAIGTDAWGRTNKSQPVLISASVSLSKPFSTASETDSVTNSTVHYGILSKAILEACGEFTKLVATAKSMERKILPVAEMSLGALIRYIQTYLTDENLITAKTLQPWELVADRPAPLLKGQGVQVLEIKVTLPKASLLGSGVSLTESFLFDGKQEMASTHSMVLRLHELRIPTLIGVNPNERLAKQMVVATVEIDKCSREGGDYAQLEEITAKTMEESSYQTLEALVSHLSINIIRFFLVPRFSAAFTTESDMRAYEPNYPRVRISLEKPTAVTFADAPKIEVLIDSDPAKSEAIAALWIEAANTRPPPFPLSGTLYGWEKEIDHLMK